MITCWLRCIGGAYEGCVSSRPGDIPNENTMCHEPNLKTEHFGHGEKNSGITLEPSS